MPEPRSAGSWTIKYTGVREKLKEKGYETTLDAFVVVMLGTIGLKNDCLLSILGVGRKYRILDSSIHEVLLLYIMPLLSVTRCGRLSACHSYSSVVC